MDVLEEIESLVDIALHDPNEYDPDSEPNVFYALIKNARTEGKLRQSNTVIRDWLVSEGATLRVAGSSTVANACTIGARYLMQDERVRHTLVHELEKVWPDKGLPMTLERLEKLPYLTAVIKESLRLSHGAASPLSRVVPDSGAIIAGHPVPPGTVVSISNLFVHLNPEIFPGPTLFRPERWMENKDSSLDRYLVAFGRGPRSCLGINLAWSELYLIMGNVFRKLDLKSRSDLSSNVRFKEILSPMYEEDVLSATVSERS
ncbi:hypothetical protein VNI00_006703 [Paramarasmius palmivorus]|uniref:Cytochrome P450 n=1 Tax=Paramarasmius palmivorus TaxID=297713 RepID=A0AAW0D825_9AGAR